MAKDVRKETFRVELVSLGLQSPQVQDLFISDSLELLNLVLVIRLDTLSSGPTQSREAKIKVNGNPSKEPHRLIFFIKLLSDSL